MVSIKQILNDSGRCSYITIIDGENDEKYIVRTLIDPHNTSYARTIVYKRLPNNPVAIEIAEMSHSTKGFVKMDTHEPIVSFIVENIDRISNYHFQESMV